MSQRPPAIEIPVALVRDYQQINREVIAALDAGHRHIRLTSVEGQRLLLSGLRGSWPALIEIQGTAGPELAAELDAPNVSILCHGSVADGSGRALRAGQLVITGNAGEAAGTWMRGGVQIVVGTTGHRAGLRLQGGSLILFGPPGRLLADRQSGGDVFARLDLAESVADRGRTGGRLIALPERASGTCSPLVDGPLPCGEVLKTLPAEVLSALSVKDATP